jgi:acetyl-CoA C-acetyltransferase
MNFSDKNKSQFRFCRISNTEHPEVGSYPHTQILIFAAALKHFMDKKEVVIVSAVRTPIGSFGGSLKDFSAARLGAFAIQGALTAAALSPELVQEVLMGCVLQANVGQAPARQAAKFAGLPDGVVCTTVNKVCASGMKAIAQAAQGIALGDIEIAIAGGMESLTDAYDGKAMGNAAELCAATCGISREAQDAFAVESYRRSQAAWTGGKFKDEVIPVEIPQRKGESVFFSKDEEPFNVKFDKIPGLKPSFQKDGTVTAANASTLNDGAAALVLMSAQRAEQLGLKPLARIVSWADAEQAPEWFTTTPSVAVPKAVAKAGLKMQDISYWELNEAFAVVGIENTKRMQLDPAAVNLHGGAVALGHPLGCSGARIIVSLLHILRQNKAKYGAAGICNGGGGASAMVIENLSIS